MTHFSSHRSGVLEECVRRLIWGIAAASLAVGAHGQSYSPPSPATGTGVALSAQSPYTGSVPEDRQTPGVLQLSFEEAITRGLKQNLGLLISADNHIAARGQRWKDLSELLPHVVTRTTESVQKDNLAARGLNFPGIPTVVGPYSYFDTRVYLQQSLLNWKQIQQSRSAAQGERAAAFNYRDARELVVLAVGNAYLQALAGAARVETAEAQQTTAKALYDKAVDQQNAGVTAAIDTLRAQVEWQTRQQQFIQAKNDYAKQKLSLARVIGLASGQEFALPEKAPADTLPLPKLEDSLQKAYSLRADYHGLLARVRSAELAYSAATAGYYPSIDLDANYGELGVRPSNVVPTFQVAGTLTIPIFQGNRVHADRLQAEATLRQTRSEAADLRGRIDSDVRNALLDLTSSADLAAVARSQVALAQQTLTQAQDRFAAGVTDNLEVIQAQESVASANENYISSLYALNIAKVTYARAIGNAEQGVQQYLKGK
jgi:outer membrane protein TolC